MNPARTGVRLVASLVVLCAAVAGCASGDPTVAPSSDRTSGGAASRTPSAGPPSTGVPTAPPAAATTASATPAPAAEPGSGAPAAGQCTQLSYAGSLASVARARRVACQRQHTSIVARVAYLRSPVTPRTPVLRRRALGQRLCAPAYREVLGGTPEDRAVSILTWTLFTPGQADLERGARWVRCDVLARSAAVLVPLPATTPLLGSGVPEQLRVCQSAAGLDISCSQPHTYRVDAVYLASGESYPSGADFTASARSRCQELTGRPGGFWQPPSPAGWQAGDRFIRCLSPALSPGLTQP